MLTKLFMNRLFPGVRVMSFDCSSVLVSQSYSGGISNPSI